MITKDQCVAAFAATGLRPKRGVMNECSDDGDRYGCLIGALGLPNLDKVTEEEAARQISWRPSALSKPDDSEQRAFERAVVFERYVRAAEVGYGLSRGEVMHLLSGFDQMTEVDNELYRLGYEVGVQLLGQKGY